MKKTMFLLILPLILLSCNNSNKGTDTTDQKEEETKTEEVVTENKTVAATESGKVITLNNNSFKALVHDYKADKKWKFKGELPCIVDFYADWCKPCRDIAPILDELAKEYEGKINIYKVDTDVEGELTNFYGIQALPTLMFCKMNGEPIKQVGAYSKADYVKMIENDLLK